MFNSLYDSYTCKCNGTCCKRKEHVGHKLYMHNFFSSLALFVDLHTKTIKSSGTAKQNR